MNIKIFAEASNGRRLHCTCVPSLIAGRFVIREEDEEILSTVKKGRAIQVFDPQKSLVGLVELNWIGRGARIAQSDHSTKVREAFAPLWPRFQSDHLSLQLGHESAEMTCEPSIFETAVTFAFYQIQTLTNH
ncbi:MAG: hypothetical protein AAFX93_03190 [Verrucomicrobiota bacterium]